LVRGKSTGSRKNWLLEFYCSGEGFRLQKDEVAVEESELQVVERRGRG